MSFPDDVDLTPDGGTTTDTYSLVSLENRKSLRVDASRAAGTPQSLTIAHESKGNGMTARDRRLIRIDLVEEDTGSDDLATISASVYMVFDTPRRIITKAQMQGLYNSVVNFFSLSGYFDKFMAGEP